MPWVGPFFVEPGSEVRVPVPHAAAQPVSNDNDDVNFDDALPAVPEEDDDIDDDSIGADSPDDKVPKPLRGRGRGRGGQRGRGRAGRGPLKRPAASMESKKRPAGVMRRPSAADGIAMRRPSAVVSKSASDGNDGNDEIPVVAPARTKPVGDKTYGCAKCRHNKLGCPGRCRKLADTGSYGYYFDEDGFVRHAQ